MTTPSTKPPLKPSERIAQLRGGTVTYAEAICAYLDEREANLHPIARANHPAAANDPVTGDCSLHSKPEPCIYCLADSANDRQRLLSERLCKSHGREAALIAERDEALAKLAVEAVKAVVAKLAASEARCEQLTGELEKRTADLKWTEGVTMGMSKMVLDLQCQLSTLRTKYDLMVATMAKDGEEADPRDAVVEAARVTMAKLENYFDEYGGEHLGDCPGDDTCECPLLVELNAALRAQQEAVTVLDRPSQPEPAGEREIMVGSTWRRRPGRSHAGVEHKVTGRSANGWVKTEAVDRYEPSIWNPTRWHEQLEWVSDPPAVTESATGGEARCECEFANSIDRLHHEPRCPCHPDHERGQP